jgi:hypothetical protein
VRASASRPSTEVGSTPSRNCSAPGHVAGLELGQRPLGPEVLGGGRGGRFDGLVVGGDGADVSGDVEGLGPEAQGGGVGGVVVEEWHQKTEGGAEGAEPHRMLGGA